MSFKWLRMRLYKNLMHLRLWMPDHDENQWTKSGMIALFEMNQVMALFRIPQCQIVWQNYFRWHSIMCVWLTTEELTHNIIWYSHINNAVLCVTNDKLSSLFICELLIWTKSDSSLIENQNKSEKLTLKGGGIKSQWELWNGMRDSPR